MKSGHKVKTKTVTKTQVCEHCGGELMKNHQCHVDTSQTKTCNICQKTMETKALRHHLQYHRRKEVSHHVCQFCTKPFTTESSLKRHILIHENSKPHSCQVCEKTFRQKVALSAHLRTHSGVRLPCNQCSRRFITKSLLTQHQKAVHSKK